MPSRSDKCCKPGPLYRASAGKADCASAAMNKSDRYTPAHFVFMATRRECEASTDHARNVFQEALGYIPHEVVVMEGYSIAMAMSSGMRSAEDGAGRVRLFLHGEVYNCRASNTTPQYLLSEYLKHGDNFAKDINGSFVILILDRLHQTLKVVTDRVNSLKVFVGETGGCLWISTSLYLFPSQHLRLDEFGVGCYLANGVVHNNRTIFSDISVLERASIHTIDCGGLTSFRYWEYTFERAQSNVDEKALQAQLSELIIESVRIRTDDDRPVYLSLSGGYDATTLLGCLRQLRIENVRCFSYAHGVPAPGSDADVAARQATLCGYDHFVLPSYQGDLASTLRKNAIKGQGVIGGMKSD